MTNQLATNIRKSWPFDKDLFDSFFNGNDLRGFDLLNAGPFQAKESNFPPHDVIKVEDNVYQIKFAVAGFDKDDIEVVVNEDVLEVEGKKVEHEDYGEARNPDYLHRGIAARNFKTKFRMPPHSEISECSLTNGILSITIEKNIPEEKLPKKVEIT